MHSTFVDIECKSTSVNYVCLHCFTRGGLLARIAKQKKIWVANPCLYCPRPTLVKSYFLSLRRLNKQDQRSFDLRLPLEPLKNLRSHSNLFAGYSTIFLNVPIRKLLAQLWSSAATVGCIRFSRSCSLRPLHIETFFSISQARCTIARNQPNCKSANVQYLKHTQISPCLVLPNRGRANW